MSVIHETKPVALSTGTPPLANTDLSSSSLTFSDLADELKKLVLDKLPPESYIHTALVCREWAVFTSGAMRSRLYEKDQNILHILKPLIDSIPEETRKELTTMERFSFSQDHLEKVEAATHSRFRVLQEHHNHFSFKVATILNKSLGIPLADAQEMAKNLVSCFSKQDFYSSLFTMIYGRRVNHLSAQPVVETFYTERTTLHHLHWIALQGESTSSMYLVVTQYLDLDEVAYAEAMADDLCRKPYAGRECIYTTMKALAEYHQKEGNLEAAVKCYKAIPLLFREQVHDALLQIYMRYRERKVYKEMLSVINAMVATHQNTKNLIKSFIEDLLVGRFSPAVLLLCSQLYIDDIEDPQLRNIALSRLSLGYQEKRDLSTAFMLAKKMTMEDSVYDPPGQLERMQSLMNAWVSSFELFENVLSSLNTLPEPLRIYCLKDLYEIYLAKADFIKALKTLQEIPYDPQLAPNYKIEKTYRIIILSNNEPWEEERCIIQEMLLDVYVEYEQHRGNASLDISVSILLNMIPDHLPQKTQIAEKIAKNYQERDLLKKALTIAKQIPDRGVRSARCAAIRTLQRQKRAGCHCVPS